MAASADSLPGWQVLSQLRLQNEQSDLAAESAGKGLKCLAQRHSKGYQSHPAVAAGIVLARGHSLLTLNRLGEAHAMFKALTGTPTLPVWQRHQRIRTSNSVRDNGSPVRCMMAVCMLFALACIPLHAVACTASGNSSCQKVSAAVMAGASTECECKAQTGTSFAQDPDLRGITLHAHLWIWLSTPVARAP